MRNDTKVVFITAVIGYLLAGVTLVGMWSIHDWNKTRDQTYTVEQEYLHIAPGVVEVGNKGDWNCDGEVGAEGQYLCSFGSYEEFYTTEDRLSRQVGIWGLGLVFMALIPIACVIFLAHVIGKSDNNSPSLTN